MRLRHIVAVICCAVLCLYLTPVALAAEQQLYDHYSDVTAEVSGDQVIQAELKASAAQSNGAAPAASIVYQIAPDLYYALFQSKDGGNGHVLFKTVMSNGKEQVHEFSISVDQVLSAEALASYESQATNVSNVTIDYTKIKSFTSAEEYYSYLQEALNNMDGTEPNDPAKSDIESYVTYVITLLSQQTLSVEGGAVTIGGTEVATGIHNVSAVQDKLTALLSERNVQFNKTMETILRLDLPDVDLTSGIQVTFQKSMLDEMKDDQSVRLFLGDGSCRITARLENLKAIFAATSALTVSIQKSSDGVYNIQFVDAEGATLDQAEANLAFSLPSNHKLNSVTAVIGTRTQNWSGQYDAANSIITFETGYSGTYSVGKETTAIADIADLSEEQQSAITYLVSRGIFTVEDGNFFPKEDMLRYDCTVAFVQMFFAAQWSATCDFQDVATDSRYYPYVASAKEAGLVNGVTEELFAGDRPITSQAIIALCARTMVNNKGYQVPENPDTYLSQIHLNGELADWAKPYVALAVREGLLVQGANFTPSHYPTRAEAAMILYQLYNKLYEPDPVQTTTEETTSAPAQSTPEEELQTSTSAQYPIAPRVIVMAVVVALLVAVYGWIGWRYFRWRKEQSNAADSQASQQE